ncbi:MAG: SAM-dependent chlorinase/fluorinase [Rhodospirillales bacterium]|nr:SAM-dependent chlorinase/fluorinase [Rhodospirillales bacterium]
MIVLFTDFGREGPYVGQMLAVLARLAPGVPAIDLLADAPAFDAKASAYLLAAYADEFSAGTVFLAVVDPGVGGDRQPLWVEADGRHFVGPDNGLFEVILRRAKRHRVRRIAWQPEKLSASFHGRDLFAPFAAGLARGAPPASVEIDAATVRRPEWPDDWAAIIYIDRFGNAMTGLRAARLDPGARISLDVHTLGRARTFSEMGPGEAFWYENANGLVEIAANRASAARNLTLTVGSTFTIK